MWYIRDDAARRAGFLRVRCSRRCSRLRRYAPPTWRARNASSRSAASSSAPGEQVPVLVERDPDVRVPHEGRERLHVDARGDHQGRVAVAALVQGRLLDAGGLGCLATAAVGAPHVGEDAPARGAVDQILGQPIAQGGPDRHLAPSLPRLRGDLALDTQQPTRPRRVTAPSAHVVGKRLVQLQRPRRLSDRREPAHSIARQRSDMTHVARRKLLHAATRGRAVVVDHPRAETLNHDAAGSSGASCVIVSSDRHLPRKQSPPSRRSAISWPNRSTAVVPGLGRRSNCTSR